MEITIKCTCNRDLKVHTILDNYGDIDFEIEPCESCMEEEYERGRQEMAEDFEE